MMSADPTPQELMTLAGIAYGAPADIPNYLADTALATAGKWELHWIAADLWIPENFAFIAHDATRNYYAVAIRGTYPNPFSPAYWNDAAQDYPFGTLVPWPHPVEAQGLVSSGTWSGFSGVTRLADENGLGFVNALQALPNGAALYVTGHSLGGTLAPVVAQWAKFLTNKPIVQAVSFAGMTPGNAAFANLIGAETQRYYNDLDSVPFGWHAVLETKDFYSPSPQGGDLYKMAIDDMAAQLAPYGYQPVGMPHRLPGKLKKYPFEIPLVTFLEENLRQHLPDTYLDLLHAPRLPFSIGFGAVVAQKSHPLAAMAQGSRFPWHFV